MTGSQTPVTDPYQAQRRSLRQVGVVLLVVCGAEVLWDVVSSVITSVRERDLSVSLSADPLLLIAGIFLYLGSLRMARVVAFCSAAWAAGGVVVGLGILWLLPDGLIWAVLQGRDVRLLVGALLYVVTLVVMAWVYRRTSDPALPRIWGEQPAVRRPRRPWLAIAIGAAPALGLVVLLGVLMRTPAYQSAIDHAKRATGARHDGFVVTQWTRDFGRGEVHAGYLAFSAREIKRIQLEWRD
jgi:hypothetical protein